MLRRAKDLKGFSLDSRDGEIGKVKDFYFDDKFWTIRYLIADTGNWLTGMQVLISPYAMTAVNHDEETITVDLTKEQIRSCPPLDNDKPVSRQYENDYFGYYGWPGYWGGPSSWGPYPYISRDGERLGESTPRRKQWDHHLRSTSVVTGYHIKADDGDIGHVEDFVIDDKTWAIRYLVIDTQNWLPGKRVLISPSWIRSVSWHDSSVYVNVSCDAIKRAPEYINESSLTREYETRLHSHYNRQGYWVDEPVAADLLI